MSETGSDTVQVIRLRLGESRITVTGPDYSTEPAYSGPVYYRSVVTGPKSPDLFQATNCMINFTVDRDGIIDDSTITGAKCRIGPHGKMHPPDSKT